MLEKYHFKIRVLLVLTVIAVIKSNFEINSALAKGGNMNLTSVFKDGTKIPTKFTCDGEDVSPELLISDVPANAKSLVLIIDDPDAPVGLFTHWVLYNIPTNTQKLSSKNIPSGAIEIKNDFGRLGYGGPCPPSGNHRYFFKLYALDKTLKLPEKATKAQLEKEIKNSLVDKTELIGLYSRK